jgi:hypothetical protein
MRNAIAVAMLSVLLMVSGCGERGRVSMETNAMTCKFDALVKAGKTTREQEQKFIEAISLQSLEFDKALRGNKKAETTRTRAQIEAKTGVDLSTPIDLDK